MSNIRKYPLLQSQYGVFLQCVHNPKTTQYNLPSVAIIPEGIDIERFVAALETIMRERTVLHTRFGMDGNGNVYQWPDMDMAIPVVHRRCEDHELQRYLDEDFVSPFNLLSGEPLVSIEVVETELYKYFLLDIHHLIADGTAITNVFTHRDIPDAYDGKSLTDEPYTMFDAAIDEQSNMQTDAYKRARQHYREKLSGMNFATLTKAGEDRTGKLCRISSYISKEKVDNWCEEQGVMPNLLFQAAFSLVISMLTRQQKVLYYSVTHGRMDKRLRSTYGMYIKTMPILADVGPDITAKELMNSLKTENFSAVRNLIYSMNQLCMDLHLVPGVSFNFLAFANRKEDFVVDGHICKSRQLERPDTFDDIDCAIYLYEDKYDIRAEGSEKVNSPETIRMISEATLATVENMMRNPEAKLRDIAIVDESAKDSLVSLGQGEQRQYQEDATFVQLFMQQAASTPQRQAVKDNNSSMTYEQLNRQSNALAHKLTELNIDKLLSPFVAVMLGCQKELLVAAIGAEKAGLAYLPLDYDYPADRLQYMMDDSQCQVLVTTRCIYNEKKSDGINAPKNILFIEDIAATDNIETTDICLATPDALAYMIYTSGSTGKPKGVMIPHRAKAAFVQFIADEWHLTSHSRICCHSSFSFDASVEDLYPVLTVGGTLYIVPSEARKDLGMLHRFIIDNGITGGCYTTQLGIMLLQMYPDLPVEYLVVGGEKMANAPECNCHLINTYGPTEFTVDATYYELPPHTNANNIPIGRPLHNVLALVTDPSGNLLPRGAVGELCLCGKQMSAGYWQKPEVTEEKFHIVDIGGGKSVKAYHTGDLVRWNADEELEYMGRIDNQVKLRGFRIELGEIEAQLSKYKGINMVSVQVCTIASTQHLVAYYTANDKINTDLLHDFLAKQLTEYMVPTVYMQLDDMPLTPNGKVDTKQLPIPEIHSGRLMVEAANEQEQELLTLAHSLVGDESFGVTDNLYDIGMTSLMTMQFVAAAQQYGYKFRVADVMRYRNIRNIIMHQNTICWWFEEYNPEKPIMVVIHGIVIIQDMLPKLETWSRQFNILCFEPTDQHFELLFADDDQREIIELYSLMIEVNMPQDATISVFWGFSWGGELAYHIACRYAQATGHKPAIFMGDSHLDKEAYFTEEAQNQLKKMMERYVNTPNAAIVERKARIVGKMQATNIEIPSYDGPVVLFNALKTASSPGNTVNIERWKQYVPHLEVIDMDNEHEDLSKDQQLIPFYMDLLKQYAK